MLNRKPFVQACLIALALIWPLAVQAADVPPPPAAVDDSPQARETIDATETPPNLNQEFEHLKDDERVEIYSYKRDDGATVEEYSVQGRVYMIKVQPKGGLPPYYLYDDNGDGVFEKRLPGGYKRPSPPMWVIKRF